MPIITPTFPAKNTTYNVRETTKRIIIKEFELAKRLTSIISFDNKSGKGITWRDLFNDIDFFSYYSVYLEIDILSTNEEDFKIWHGFVESKLRNLIKLLEEVIQIRIHPFPMEFRLTDMKFKFSSSYFFGIEFVDPNTIRTDTSRIKDNIKNINLREIVLKFCQEINESIRNPETMNVRITLKKIHELPPDIFKKSRKTNKFMDVSSYDELENAWYSKKKEKLLNNKYFLYSIS